jgi:hypothetical protein
MKPARTKEMLIVVRNTLKRLMVTAISRAGAGIISQAKARGSLSETQYFIHLAGRLGYVSAPEVAELHAQTKLAFGCLHGLIKAVEREAGKAAKIVAAITSLLVLGLARWYNGPLS